METAKLGLLRTEAQKTDFFMVSGLSFWDLGLMSMVYGLARLENLRLFNMQHATFQDLGLVRRVDVS